MAGDGGRADRPLARRLREEPRRFDFYQLVRLLLAERRRAGVEADAAGRDADLVALDAHLRFRADLAQAFPAHEVRSVEGDAPDRVVIETANYVLAGYRGPLPEALVEQMRDRLRDGDEDMVRFLDVFNHRINALRYRLKARARIGLNLRRPEDTLHAAMLSSFIGLGTPGLMEQLLLPPREVLGLAGLLLDPRRSAPVLTRVVGRFTGAEVRLESLVGAFRDRPARSLTRLGVANRRLGRETFLGARAWIQTARVRLVVGPLTYARFCALLPKGLRHGREHVRPYLDDMYPQFANLIRFLLDRRHDAWVHLRLAAGEAPPSRLTARPLHRGYYGLRLGQTAWLSGGGRGERAVRFLVEAYAPEENAA